MQKFVLMTTVGLMVLGLSAPASAGHCNGEITDVAGLVYSDDRDGVPWIYVETNGEAGLQSGGTAVFGWTDPCSHDNPDTLVY